MELKVVIDHKLVLAVGLSAVALKLCNKVSPEAAKEVLDKLIGLFKGNLLD